jgi:hypothetical protein
MPPGGGRRDVVWKEEFRIDAAFEIENSTSIFTPVCFALPISLWSRQTRFIRFLL